MAGVATVAIKVKITGLDEDFEASNSQTMTVPVEYQSGYTVVETATTTAIQLFDMIDHIALAKIYGVYLKAVSGTIYITVDTAGTGTITSSTADLVLNEGEACYIPVNPGGNLGMVIDAASVTDAFRWVILGKS
jgi:hypothetical protein